MATIFGAIFAFVLIAESINVIVSPFINRKD